MKKITSVGALALRLTFGSAILAMLITLVLQVVCFARQEIYFETKSFEWIVDETGVRGYGEAGLLCILVLLLRRCSRPGMGMTLGRLNLSENAQTAVWSLVFCGYYLLAWGLQLVTVLGFYGWFASKVEARSIHLFLAAYRSGYFHNLLPLGESLGYVRNVVLCLCFGAMTALLARQLRHGGKPWLAGVLVLCVLLLPNECGSYAADIAVIVILLSTVAAQCWLVREVECNEA